MLLTLSTVRRTLLLTDSLRMLAPHQYQIPNSKACHDALVMVRACSPDFLLNHFLISYAFGIAMAHKVERNIDEEVFLLVQ